MQVAKQGSGKTNGVASAHVVKGGEGDRERSRGTAVGDGVAQGRETTTATDNPSCAVLTWNVRREQKLMIFPRRRGTMCCPALCESSQTDLRFTFRTCGVRAAGMDETRRCDARKMGS